MHSFYSEGSVVGQESSQHFLVNKEFEVES